MLYWVQKEIERIRSIMQKRTLEVWANGELLQVAVGDILYIVIPGTPGEHIKPQVHMLNGEVFSCTRLLNAVEEKLGDGFIRLSRRCVAAIRAIHTISDYVYLNNGEKLAYSPRKKQMLIDSLHEKQKEILHHLAREGQLMSTEEYCEYYRSFDHMPFAFTDIKMVFDDSIHAVDWVFCYGNEALAELEKTPLDALIGKSFGTIFANMDPKWLKSYEQAALYGKTLEIIDYSPEIDTYLHVTCFPTFPGHCGCILKDIAKVQYAEGNQSSEKALRMYLAHIVNA